MGTYTSKELITTTKRAFHTTSLICILEKLPPKWKGLSAHENTVQMYFDTAIQMTDKELSNLGTVIGEGLRIHKWRRVKELELNLISSAGAAQQSASEGLRIVIAKLSKHLDDLQRLTLRFRTCHEIDDKGLEMLGAEISRQFPQLKKLTIKFQGCDNITNKGFMALAKNISKHAMNLRHLTLSLSMSGTINDHGIAFAAHAFSVHLAKLQHLTLKFNMYQEITDKGLEAMVTSLSRRGANLQRLSLAFASCNITDKGLQVIGTEIPKYLTNLKHLVLSFEECEEVTFKGKSVLVWKLRSIPKFDLENWKALIEKY